jgi:integrase
MELCEMGRYKHGKPNEETSLQEFESALEKGYFTKPLQHKSYLAVVYWIGARRTEPLEMKKEDVTLEGCSLFLKIPAKKHGERGGLIELPLTWRARCYLCLFLP